MLTPASGIAILGFGDDCRRIAAALAPRGCALRVFDPRADHSPEGTRLRTRIEALGVDVMADAADALRGARLVVLDAGCPAGVVGSLRLPEGQMLLDLRGSAEPINGAAGCAGWFDADALRVRGDAAPKLAAALSAIGLRSEPVVGGLQPVTTASRARASARMTRPDDPLPAVRRAELP